MTTIKRSVNRLIADIKEYGWAGVVFLGYYVVIHIFRAAFCPMIATTGLPCAGCGLSRAFLYLFSGQIKRAAYINPMCFLIVVFLLYCGYFRYIKGEKIKGFRLLFGLLVFAMLLFYAVRMYLYFPDRIPYVYTRNNLLANRIPGYQDMINKLLQMIRASR